jgi:DNA-directed RNA polymerase
MLVPPKNWTAEETGGWWFTAHVMSSKLIRGFKQRTMVSQKTLDFINTQQQIPFKINHFTLDVLKWMHQKGYSLGSFRTNPHLDPPPKPPGLEGFRTPRKADLDYLTGMELEELKVKQNMLRSFKRATTLYHDTLAEWLQLSIPIHLFFKVVDYVKDDPQFFFPWNLDWRTRCYPLVSMLSPQGPEYMKACLSWGEDHPLDKQSRFWMANNLGVAAGLSKRPYRERVRWVKDHMREVIAVATDPTGEGFEIWRNMDEPFVFLATAREYYECFIAKTKNTTNLFCCGHDATCSGLQLLGGMVKDKQTCSMVNCTGEFDTPQDAYGEVLAAALDILKGTSFPVDKIKGKRSLVKPAVMTKAYGAGHDTRVAQITDQLEEEGIKLSRNPDRHKELIEVLTNAVEQAMATVIPGADEILDWFQTTARKAYEELGKEYLLIESASGNVIGSEYRHMITKHVETETLGTTVYMPKRSDDRSKQRGSESAQVRAVDSEGDPDVESGILGIGANLTHGAGDAALLQLAFHDADFTFSTTHDCVYTPCTQAAKQAHMRVREAFIEICNYPTLQRYAALNGIQDMPPPIKGDYDPDDVLKSRYFFC